MVVELRVLGDVGAWIEDRRFEVGHPRQRCVFAVLAVEANRVVTVDQLLERVWSQDLPLRGRQVLRNYLSRLRLLLAPAGIGIERRSSGYVLLADPGVVDVLRFRHLITCSRDADDEQALGLYDQALALWRGEPFAGLETPWLAAVRTGLEREHIAARLDRVEVALRCGRHTEVLPELFTLVEQQDVDERVAAQFMLALHRAGRTTEALAHYRHLRDRLIEQLGTEPGTALQVLHQRILDTDPALTPPSTAITRGTAPKAEQPMPRQLPAPPRWFTGRGTELARLDHALTAEPEEDPIPSGTSSGTPAAATVMISAIGGAGGIGKTWLALAWAHRHAERFPDGQLFVDLHGFSPAQEPMKSGAAVRGFLDALGVDPDRIPTDLDAQAALYRSLVAERRMLIVLDNAASAEQVVPLLPGSPSCTVLITSRTRLASLIDRHSTRQLQLDVLDRADARALLTGRLGAGRVTAEPDAVDELVELCRGYPLALSITARHAATRPAIALAEIAAELRALGLEMLDHDTDPAASLPAVLSWSLRRLTDEHRTVFTLLGVTPGPDTTLPAVAALTGLPSVCARKALSALEEASLLERRPHGRYAMHDLVRAYAATTAHDLPDHMRETALIRVMDFHLHTASAAERLLNPHGPLLRPDPPASGVRPHPLPDAAAALAWLEAEHTVLLATQRAAVSLGRHHVVWHLTWAMDTFHLRRGHLRDSLAMWRAALNAAVHLPDPTIRSRTHRSLGNVCSTLSLHEEATTHLAKALDLAVRHNNPTEQAHTHEGLAAAWTRRGDDQRALDHARHALDLYHALEQPTWEADTLNLVGWFAARLGDLDTARHHCLAALTLHRKHYNPDGEAATLDSLGFIADRAGDHRLALEHYQQALSMYRTLGNTYEIANTLDNTGHPHTALGQHDQARDVWQEALELYHEQGRDDDASRVQRQLDDLGSALESFRPSGLGETT
ncbi:BTAD domain-containing putative transcriptional regulator [Lentzea sp. NPDC005914]|uniref:AfsR/SARP family transcriptional regulator n=1 Tax=Lentzea sp. NPDC005914 TaxID=3154572 RepID=UPI0033CCB16A